jgi:hypothetical protein
MRKVLIVVVVLLIGGLIAADRIGVVIAQNEIGRQIANQYNLQKRPKVSIAGFPFLTQAIGGSYDKITVNIGDWTQQSVTVHELKIQMSGLHAPLSDVINNNTSNITADTGTASAIIPFEALKQQAPKEVKEISASGSDLLIKGTVKANLPVVGVVTSDLTATVKLKATAQGIQVTPDTVQNSGGQSIPIGLLSQRLSFLVPVRNLPIGSRISQVDVTPTGLRVAATANNVRFSQLPNTGV